MALGFGNIWKRKATLLALMVSGPLALAQITLTVAKPCVVAGNLCELKARLPDGTAPDGAWETEMGTVHLNGDGRAFYTAPLVEAPRRFWVRVSDHRHPAAAQVSIQVLPRLQGLPDLLAECLLPETQGTDWLTPVPRMTLFAGAEGRPPLQEEAVFHYVSCLAFVDDPAMGELHLKWLVGDARGIKAVSGLGDPQALPELPSRISAVAVRPRLSHPDSPRHVVFAQDGPSLRRSGGVGAYSPWGTIWTLAPDGQVQLLAGVAWPGPMETPFRNGLGTEARFGQISALAVDAAGTVFVADRGNRVIRKISPEGAVSTLAGNEYTGAMQLPAFPFSLGLTADGLGAAAGFERLHGLALDPATGELYVADGHALRKVTPQGEVTTLLGAHGQPGFEPGPPDQPVPLGVACLDEPRGLQLVGDNLFIADTGNNAIRVFNLQTRLLRTLAGTRQQSATRLGPLALFAPGLPPEACAALHFPCSLAISPGGSCLVGLDHGLAHLDLGPLAE